jgi:eukaryotic-like serine/threonine-protein kinase
MVEPDTIIDGRYRVISRLGSGGMADVYLAEDQLLGRQVAVKLLHHHFAEDQEFVERFRREASSAARLSHPNIVGIFDRGEWQGTYYIAMEYVAGRSLKTTVREQGALDPASAIDIVVQILRAARFAHRRGVIHRDLKPHNVILDEEGRARVTDFGIARAGASDMTLTGSIMGTAQYLSPEQAQGLAVSTASDLYSVGVILYELLTGVVPFEGETAVAIAFKQVSAEPRPPSAVRGTVPAALDAIVLRALAKDPAERFADADEFIAELQRAREALPASAGAAVLTAGEHGREGWGAHGDEHWAAAVVRPLTGPLPADGARGDTGGLLLPAGGRSGEAHGPTPEKGRVRRRVLLWVLAAAVIAAAVVLALLLGPATRRVTVPNVIRQSEPTAVARLRRAGLTPVASLAASATVASGLVLSEAPSYGSRVARGTRVNIVVSSGPASAALASVEGLTVADALATLRAAGFKPRTKTEPSTTIAQGRAIGTDPPVGTEAQVGSPVVVLVSSGPPQVRVPDVTGESQTSAEAALGGAGFTVGTVTQRVSGGQAPGTVLSQSPHAGASVPTGASVNLTVAQAPNEIAVPSVLGNTERGAVAALGSLGFAARIVSGTTILPAQVGIVLKQSPSPGRRERKGSTVTLTVGAMSPPTPTTPTTTTPTSTTTTTTTTPPAAPAG